VCRLVFIVVFLLVCAPIRHASGDPVDDALHVLARDLSPRVRAQAALALDPLAARPEVRRALSAALSDADPIVRAAAAKSLSGLAPAEAWIPLCQAALDPDPMVARWAARAERRVLARAAAVSVGIRGIVALIGRDHDLATRTIKEVVLEHLLKSRRYSVDASFDFSEQVAVPVGEGPVIRLDLEGEASSAAADAESATVRVVLRAVAPSGHVVWQGQADATGRHEAPAAPGPDDDEYTLRQAPPEASLVALRIAAEAVAPELVKALASEGEAPPEESSPPRRRRER